MQWRASTEEDVYTDEAVLDVIILSLIIISSGFVTRVESWEDVEHLRGSTDRLSRYRDTV